MRISTLRRGAMLIAAAGAALFAFSSTASAATVEEEWDSANIKLAGGEALALNLCLNDARDGVITTQQNACTQIATSGDMISLENVNLYVWDGGWSWQYYQGHYNSADVVLGGNAMAAANLCINDAQDNWYIDTQINSCMQTASAGNLITLTGVYVAVLEDE